MLSQEPSLRTEERKAIHIAAVALKGVGKGDEKIQTHKSETALL